MSANRILIFDLDAAKNQALLSELNARGVAITLCAQIDRTLSLIEAAKHDAAIVYLSPTGNGLSLLGQLDLSNSRAKRVPVLIATDKEATALRITGLDYGAADYLVCPFDADQLLARIDTVRERLQTRKATGRTSKKIVIDRDGRIGDGSSWTWLTPTECQALSLLMKHRDQTVAKEVLKSALEKGQEITDNAIGVAIYRLRTKIRPYGLDIRARRRIGYVLEAFTPQQETHQ